MGCVFGKEISSEIVSEKSKDRNSNLHIHSGRAVIENTDNSNTGAGGGDEEVENVVDQKVEKDRSSRGRRRSKPNPRLSNPPKNIHGEQVAAGWPAWLSAVAGEAINGWTPRRADTFEKIDKASVIMRCISLVFDYFR